MSKCGTQTFDTERCVSCGEIIPEGFWVCKMCESDRLQDKVGFRLAQNDHSTKKAVRRNDYINAKS